jgi:hypothetical protein
MAVEVCGHREHGDVFAKLNSTKRCLKFTRRSSVSQFWADNAVLHCRHAGNFSPSSNRIDSPYELDAHHGLKRTTEWASYNVRFVEICAPWCASSDHEFGYDSRTRGGRGPCRELVKARRLAASGALMAVGWDESGAPAEWQEPHAGREDGQESIKNGGAFGLAPPECWMGLRGFRVLSSLCWWLCRGRLCGLRFVLRSKLLLDLGGDCRHVHLVELRGLA